MAPIRTSYNFKRNSKRVATKDCMLHSAVENMEKRAPKGNDTLLRVMFGNGGSMNVKCSVGIVSRSSYSAMPSVRPVRPTPSTLNLLEVDHDLSYLNSSKGRFCSADAWDDPPPEDMQGI
ncbi:hypothetical protein M422DRAFT_34065 [Sphaerobolus stellatus SS14]|uniref:Uncharacterized protein n=1 Tax=Sphaerobolus stellatus (strain SS14) TaxID=990650 RepID=A0A0C9VH92_SPHS4|nr:hypothetical protein M422DRAFT_34065 [Sphaerobolus stellatus SS14]